MNPAGNGPETRTFARAEIKAEIFDVFRKKFEIDNPGLHEDLREKYQFDSIDAIELLLSVEDYLGCVLTQEEKKQAMDIRTINQILDYVENLVNERSLSTVSRART